MDEVGGGKGKNAVMKMPGFGLISSTDNYHCAKNLKMCDIIAQMSGINTNRSSSISDWVELEVRLKSRLTMIAWLKYEIGSPLKHVKVVFFITTK